MTARPAFRIGRIYDVLLVDGGALTNHEYRGAGDGIYVFAARARDGWGREYTTTLTIEVRADEIESADLREEVAA